MNKIIKVAKNELRKNNKSPEERDCLRTILRVAKAMSKNSEIKIEIIPRAERIHLIPADEADDGWHPCEKEMLDELMNMHHHCCCEECGCDDSDEEPDRNPEEKASRIEAGESM